MKYIRSLIFLISLLFISCDNTNDIPSTENVEVGKVSFLCDDKKIELNNFYFLDIIEDSSQEVIGKHLIAYDDYENDENRTSYKIEFFFFTTDSNFNLFAIHLNIIEKVNDGAVTSITSVYKNVLNDANYNDLFFNHTIYNENNKKIKGNFEGEVTDIGLLKTIVIQGGEIEYYLP
ncbi:hypothetical protein GN157_11455 [Flavobacterium rakeshii]|uniref:Uncharacterized protein n=1 Tax=Flavobacterium rakeshii TaxID=1038845 RepID=A0A6N8HF34_9FLAO|nr:hypothetical protein [Flavobacterium rakeshii]MUV04325.1 hypothetical protein [Flavobacterium rakeshii]